jgi:tRNA nucleotidyltransferase (CCA-adding enzyme)
MDGLQCYRVGGSVRDELLGLPVVDRDWVVIGSSPEEMQSLGFKPVGRDFPVFLHPQTREEYALARTERKTGKGYLGFSFHAAPEVTLDQDLQRRDLTINAMARDEQGRLIDPFNGAADLRAGILRHVSPAFSEDPLRLLRAARFAARFGFGIAPETLNLLRQISASGELQHLAVERVWQETERALGENRAPRYFEVLRECRALAELFPEIDDLFGIPQPMEKHPEIDSGLHTMMVLEAACGLSADPEVRFAALVHDLGKATTPLAELPGHKGHERRGVALVEGLCARYRIPKSYRELAVMTARYHLDCHRLPELRAATVQRRLRELDAYRRPARFEKFLLACMADARGRGGKADDPYPQADLFRRYFATARQVEAKGLAGAGAAGSEVGKLLDQARTEAIRRAQSG